MSCSVVISLVLTWLMGLILLWLLLNHLWGTWLDRLLDELLLCCDSSSSWLHHLLSMLLLLDLLLLICLHESNSIKVLLLNLMLSKLNEHSLQRSSGESEILYQVLLVSKST